MVNTAGVERTILQWTERNDSRLKKEYLEENSEDFWEWCCDEWHREND